jgi:hypothetical protein
MNTLSVALIFAVATAVSAHFDYANCGTGQCVGAPAGCIDTKVTLNYITRYVIELHCIDWE